MTHRPTVTAAVFLIIGIILGRYAPLALLAAVLPLAVAAPMFDRLPLKRVIVYAAAFAAFAALGFGLAKASLATAPMPLGGAGELNVTVKDVGRTRSGRAKALVRVDSPVARGMVIMLYGDAITDANPKPGDWLTVHGELEALSFPRNPGGYDEFMYLRSRKAQYKMFPDTAVKTGAFKTPIDWIKALREPTLNRIARLYPGSSKGIMQALIVGDQTAIDEETAALYQDAGIYHILAVSGLHVAIAALALSRLLRPFGKRFTDVSVLILLLVYTIFTGCGAATVRSAIMAALVIIAGMTNRRADIFAGLSVAALALLVYEPLYLWDAGFLYSFAAILGMALLSAPVERLLGRLTTREKPRKVLVKYMGGSLAAIIATAPVSLFFFYKVSLAAILVNAVLLPTVFAAVVLGFLSLIFAPFAYLARALLSAYGFVCGAAVKLPFAVILLGKPPLAAMLFLAAALLLWALSRGRFKAVAVAACLAAGVGVFAGARVYESRQLRVVMLDVGQGDATVFRYHGAALFIDGGGNFMKGIGDNTGRWVCIPYLNYLGVSKADAILTHIDADHALGLIEAMQAGRIRTLFIGDIVYKEPDEAGEAYSDGNLFALLMAAAEGGGCTVERLKAGDSLTFAGGVSIDCLYPPQGLSGGKTNNQSLVTMIKGEGVSMLFTGDAEDTAERRLLAANYDLSADVLKVPHHGSKTSSTPDFLSAVSPRIAIIGVSAKNNYGHPNPLVVGRLKAGGAAVYTTAKNGAITLTAKGGAISLKTMGGSYEDN